METKICSYCGMEYPASDERCPLCGHREALPAVDEYLSEPEAAVSAPRPRQQQQQTRSGRRTGARVAPSSSPIPRWLVVLTCVILALAVIIFVMFLLSYTGVFDREVPDDGSVSLPMNGESDQTGDDPSDSVTDPDDQSQNPSGGNTGLQTVACTGVTLTQDVYTPEEIGDDYILSAVVTPANCNEPIYWESSDPTVCTVSDNGVVTVIAEGDDVTITATCGAYSASCVIEVSVLGPKISAPGTDHSLDREDITFFSVGETTTLVPGNTLPDDEITWESDDTSIATVTQSGYVTAVNRGTTTVRAIVNGESFPCIVRCQFAEVVDSGTAESGSYAISHTDVTLHYLENETFRLSLIDFDGTVVWTSSNAAVCTVSDNNIIRAEGPGTANVSATVNGVTYTCIVRCME